MTRHVISAVDHNSLSPWLKGRSFADLKSEYDRKGYLVFDNVMSAPEIARVRDALQPYLNKPGRNNFEGYKSHRVYSLLAKAPEVFSDMVSHPLALAFAEADLGDSCLLSSLLAIDLQPDETVQPWHHDDFDIFVPRPRAAYGLSAFWAIDDTTEENGATEIIPGSHLWGADAHGTSLISDFDTVAQDVVIENNVDPQPHPDTLKVTLAAGSLMIAKGTLIHRGGANHSTANRLIVTPQYCVGWARQLENMMAAVPRSIVATLPKRTRELIGYNIHSGFMGYVDGVHPERVLKLPPQD
ncbi:MAG: phytanoyl-CoA dioxygenase family protein [Porticoccaceae bacterium]|jgi:ectoine hydroxylase-related dioxygenase (phytanoyl-CoA dioxygenase family)|nr:phytanoyl-CoA dioxygenase family protein [Porticoccaceae bacterium]MBT3797691.1 phytanoyl-CoA dioxygenase family protein [Porticoccaceae bacterium]MBT4164977.1 phytanoyl-CoA dioxygenase family protein [Porticoccaceae bacterium]MBT4591419.1 phytanoyl-CoA dioxygenase family protein [Porticoccaceae bacterium]MBT5003248.1 phytanoyl-CoA dioxygenase family protein [Porticoccaceae bacterium]